MKKKVLLIFFLFFLYFPKPFKNFNLFIYFLGSITIEGLPIKIYFLKKLSQFEGKTLLIMMNFCLI